MDPDTQTIIDKYGAARALDYATAAMGGYADLREIGFEPRSLGGAFRLLRDAYAALSHNERTAADRETRMALAAVAPASKAGSGPRHSAYLAGLGRRAKQ